MERKGAVAVALHWRQRPELEAKVTAIGRGLAELIVHGGYRTLERAFRELSLADAPNTILTPHVASHTSQAYHRQGAVTVEEIRRYAQGQRLQVFPPVTGGAGFNTGSLEDLRLVNQESAPAATGINSESRLAVG